MRSNMISELLEDILSDYNNVVNDNSFFLMGLSR